MSLETTLERVDGLIAIVERISAAHATGDEHALTWEIANLKLILEWLAQDLELALESGTQ